MAKTIIDQEFGHHVVNAGEWVGLYINKDDLNSHREYDYCLFENQIEFASSFSKI